MKAGAIARPAALLAAGRMRDLLEALQAGRGRGGSVSLTGLPAPAKALHLLAIRAGLGVPVAVIVRSDAEAESLRDDLRALGAAFRLADPATIHLFPSLDADPYQGIAAHLSRVGARARALEALASGGSGILIVPVEALFTPLVPPGAFAARRRVLAVGADWPEADDPGWLPSAGYERVEEVSSPGEFCRRGGLLDVYPPALDAPVRIELDGTAIASIRAFDPEAQRSTVRLETCAIAPARELPLGGAERAALSRALSGKGEAGGRLIAALEQQGRFPGVEACGRIALAATAGLLDHAAGHLLAVDEPEMTREEARNLWADLLRSHEAAPGTPLPPPASLFFPVEAVEAILDGRPEIVLRHLNIEGEPREGRGAALHVACAGPASYRGRLPSLLEELKRRIRAGETTCVLMRGPGTARRLREILEEAGLPARDLAEEAGGAGPAEAGPSASGAAVHVGVGAVGSGFSLLEAGWHLLTEREVFGTPAAARPRAAAPAFASDFKDLRTGDLVVHVDHGIGRYEGLTRLRAGMSPGAAAPAGPGGGAIEAMILVYQSNDRLYVPVDRLDLVQKYSGAGGKPPALDRLGGQSWGNTKRRVRREMEEMAVELLNLYAARKTVEGHAFAPDTEWQREFETAFPWTLTPDQERAIEAVKRDMEGAAPMDRLLCGDVGFGKTEVALRAAFKAVMDGRQVAVLAPTTVLAFQHFNTFRDRFAPFPAKVEMLSRFRSPREQQEIAARAAAGDVDVLVGTHRLLSADVAFRDLGLLIVDEEQRFGVAHKEKIKKLRRSVDVLTLTATPIPRTLQMAMAGVLDLSLVETAPENRLAIQTHLVPFKESIIAPAIRHELQRGGQVYFLHNRVDSIDAAARLVQRLVPEARVAAAHGRMGKNELEDAMLRFVGGGADVLVATTIIENGLDIPRVNTLVVNRADRFGLAQLYQLRGRIGRSDRQAYAYLLVPPGRTLTETARRRLQALQDFTELGSGFRIAAMDLEIRGAGDLLGGRQHGHIAAVGFEMYCRMLQRTIEEMRTGRPLPEFRSTINLGVDLRIPESYVPEEGLRLVVYRKIASARTEEEIDAAREEMEDRFGRLPGEGLRLLEAARLRLLAERLHVQQIDLRAGTLQVKFAEASPVDPSKILAVVRGRDGAAFAPTGVLRLPARWEAAERFRRAYDALRPLE
jgi:transcription-repair coupling factor (superfamily II helicase)